MSKPDPSPQTRHAAHTFDIDNYLNHVIPRPRFYLLPTPISYWFGYRAPKKTGSTPTPRSVLLNYLFSFLGAFIGIAIIENVFRALPPLSGHPAPLVIASFGAAAILEYNAIESPLSQPRNLILGHFLAAAVGVAITKLFRLLSAPRFEELRWLAGALSVGVASTVMSVTKTVHPPAGATALLAATTPEMTVLGWWLLPLVLLACALMLASAMLVNNLYKRFPLYWWTPVDLSAMRAGPDVVGASDAERADRGKGEDASASNSNSAGASVSGSDATLGPSEKAKVQSKEDEDEDEGEGEVHVSRPGGEQYDTREKKRRRNIHEDPELKIQIEVDRIVVPDWMGLSQWEIEALEGFQTRLRESVGSGVGSGSGRGRGLES